MRGFHSSVFQKIKGGFIILFVYPAIFHKEDESYWVEFPDLKGCNTYGSTIPEAMEMAQEALT